MSKIEGREDPCFDVKTCDAHPPARQSNCIQRSHNGRVIV